MVSLQPITIIITLIISAVIYGCAPPGFIPNQDPTYIAGQCSDLILYPVKSVDQEDQYRFDYSDVSFGNTHSQGATVTITCTERGRPATVEGYDQQRTSITSSPSLVATCTNVDGSQYAWTTLRRILQFVDCQVKLIG
uniref:C6 domain-containing protein n=1 Tax=Wuchereria bancrofti TaxID=6293 RepID=A0A1I8ELL9_WUCBA